MAQLSDLFSRPTAAVPVEGEVAPPSGELSAPVVKAAGKTKAPKTRKLSEVLTRSTVPVDEEGKPVQAPAPEVPEKPIVFQPSAENAKEFSALDSLARGGINFASMIASGVGATETGVELADYAAKNYPAHTPDVTKLDLTADDIGSFVGERFIENAPNLAATLGGAWAGAQAGGALGTAIPVPLVGTLSGAALGGIVGGLGATFLPIYGEARQSAQRETGKDEPLAVLPTAAINTLLETAAPVRIAKKLGLTKATKEAIKETAKENPTLLKKAIEAGKETFKTGSVEAGTETIQQFNMQVTNKLLKHEDVLTLSDEDKNELINAFAGGFAAGGPAGGLSSVAGNIIARDTPEGERVLASKDSDAQLHMLLKQKLAEIAANEATFDRYAAQRDIEDPSGFGTDLETIVRGQAGTPTAVPGAEGLSPETSDQSFGLDAFHNMSFDTTDQDGNAITLPITEQNIQRGKVTPAFNSKQTPDVKQKLTAKAELLTGVLNKMGLTDMKIVLADEASFAERFPGFASTANGWMTRLGDGTYIMASKPETAADPTGNLKYVDPAKQTLFQEESDIETGLHELGHIIFDHTWQRATPAEQKALMQGYKETVKEALTGDQQKRFDILGMPSFQHVLKGAQFFAKRPIGPDVAAMPDKGPGSATYLSDMPEYTANQFARYALNRVAKKQIKLPEGIRTLYARAYRRLESLYRLFKRDSSKLGRPVHESFEAFLNNMFLKEEVRQIQNALGAMGPVAKQEKQKLIAELKGEEVTKAQDPIDLNTTTYSHATSGSYQPIYSVSFLANFVQSLGLHGLASKIRQHEDLSMGYARISSLLTPIQVAELARKAGFNNPDEYMQIIREFANTKMKQVERADHVLNMWKKMGKDASNRVSKLLYEISTSSDEKGRQLNIKEIDVIAQSIGATQEDMAAWRQIDNSFREILENIERGLIYEAARSHNADIAKAKQFREDYLAATDDATRIDLIEQFTGVPFVDPNTLALGHPLFTELEAIRTSIRKMSNKNYFPRSRMGEYVVKVTATAKGQKWEGHTAKREGETLGYYAFDTKKERDAALKEMLPDATTAGVAIAGDKLETEIYSLMSMPQIMIDKIGRELNLTDEQAAKLRDISLNLAPGKRFLRHLQKRRGIAGYNEDAMRVYANYMMSASNHLARVEHSRDLIQALNDIDAFIADKKNWALGTVLDDVTRLRDYFRRHFQYVMKPDNDWAGLRAMGFVWYLGFNVKSALVNMTQVPFVTYPVLGAKYGDKRAATEITKAYGSISKWLLGKQNLSADEQALIDTLREQGVIDESMVSELAGFGEADVLKRMIPGLDLKGGLNRISYYAGTMFRMGEKYNRLVTSMSAYRLARQKGLAHDAAVKEARWAVETTQYEYTKWNRPEFMRGKKSIIFMFWQYMQHSAFLFAGGQGKQAAMRMWVMTALTAGLLGLPFAETILDIIDLSGTAMKKLFGANDPRVDTREFIRDLLLEITDQPDKILYGMSSYWGLGPLHLAGLFGAPIPNVDVQGSLSYGRMIPWIEPLTADATNADEKMGRVAAAVSGPIIGIPLQMYKAVASDDPNKWKAVEKSLPVFMKNAVQGTRWLMEGQETFRGEGKLMDFSDPEGRVASALKALGFQPTPLTQKYRQIRAGQEAATYYGTRRQLLMADFYQAKMTKDREGMADVKKAIVGFNKAVQENPALRGMAIRGRDLTQSYNQRVKSVKKREAGIAASRREQPIQTEIQRLYPVEGE